MKTFEYRLNYADGTFAIVAVEADDIMAAGAEIDRRFTDAVSSRLLVIIDRAPQVALAF